MHTWLLRICGIALALVPVYLAHSSAHQSLGVLITWGAASALALLCVIALLRRPAVATVLSVVILTAAIVAQIRVIRRGGGVTTPRIAWNTAPAATPPSVAASASIELPSPGDASPTDNPPPWASLPNPHPASGALTAPQTDSDYSEYLGPGSTDDGISSTQSYLNRTVAAVDLAAQMFSTGPAEPTATPDPLVSKLRDMDARIPASEYTLSALDETLPNNPLAINDFVRDHVGTDIYNGAMRGPLGAWMNRAANPTDKLLLVAWLLVHKGIHIQFVRGTLSQAEREQILTDSRNTAPVFTIPNHSQKPDIANYVNYVRSCVAAGEQFARWASRKLADGKVALGTGAVDSSKIDPRHYWLQVDSGGKLLDLDPTVKSLKDGEHLATEDSTFAPNALLPSQEYQFAQVRLLATAPDGSKTTLVSVADSVVNLAYTPIAIAIVPETSGNDQLQTLAMVGSKPMLGTPITTSGVNVPQRLVLEVRRKDTSGTISAIQRVLFDRNRRGDDSAWTPRGLHTVIFAPGVANELFAHEELRTAEVIGEAFDAQRHNHESPERGLYPARIVDYLLRDDAIAAALSSSAHMRLFRDRPDVIMMHTLTTSGDDSGSQHLRAVFDIADNGMNAVGDNGAIAQANLARGWADTWTEGDIMQGSGSISAWLNAKAHNESYALRTSIPGQYTNPTVALAPGASNAPSSWWEIEPATGSVVGRSAGGYGDSLSEYAAIFKNVSMVLVNGYQALQVGQNCLAANAKQLSIGCMTAVCGFATTALFSVLAGPEPTALDKAGSGVGNVCSIVALATSQPTSGGGAPTGNAPSASDGAGPGGT
jgi:hypothetical protein